MLFPSVVCPKIVLWHESGRKLGSDWRNPAGGPSEQPVDLDEARRTPLGAARGTRPETIVSAAVVLLVALDLTQVTAMDSGLGRLSIPGGSVYPFAHNIVLAARDAGY